MNSVHLLCPKRGCICCVRAKPLSKAENCGCRVDALCIIGDVNVTALTDFDKRLLTGLLKETDRRLRLYLKTGHPLKERKEAAWAVPYIEAVIEADRKAKLEAARPKVSIDFSGLDKIRKDALETQDNLLTEEETQCTPETASKPSEVSVPSGVSVPLDGMQMQLLRMLLRGEPVQELIAAQHGMPSVIADAINEALFDLIGDTVVECDGKTITLVEDYRDNIIGILG